MKLYIFKVFLIFLVLNYFFTSFILAKDNLYEAGMIFYQQGKYYDALKFFSEAIKENPNNEICIYYFARSLQKTNNDDYAREYYNKIIDTFPKSKFAEYSKLEIAKIKRKINNVTPSKPGSIVIDGQLISTSNSYIDKLQTKVTWDTNKMPLNVFIGQARLKEFETYVWKSFEIWENESYNVLSFTRVNDINDADIIVTWDNSITNNKNIEMGGITTLSVTNGTINKATIFLIDTNKTGGLLSFSDIRSNAMFNIGRAVGITNNSDSKLDIMYPSSGKNNLTKRDKNTLVLIYKPKEMTINPKEPTTENSNSNEVIQIKKPKKKKIEKQEKTEKKKEDNKQ